MLAAPDIMLAAPYIDCEARFFSRSTGLRLAVNPDEVLSLAWELVEAGGAGQITCEVAHPADDPAWPVQGGDTAEIWALGTGETVPRCRGQVGHFDKVLDMTERFTLTAYGRMEDMNRVLLDRVACIPGGGDLSLFAAQIAGDYQKRRPALRFVRDIQVVDVSLETLTQADSSARAAMDAVIAQAGGNAVWGWDIDPATGLDRFYLRPKRTSGVQAQFFVGGGVQLLSSPRELQGLANAVKIEGGPARYPNLAYNGGFELPVVPSAQAGNLLPEGGFEDPGGWNYINGATRNQAGNTPGGQTPHTGEWLLLLDHPGEEAWWELPASFGQPYAASCFAARENGQYAAAGRLVVEGRTPGGSVAETYTLPLAPPSASWTGGQDSTVLAGDALSLSFTLQSSAVSVLRVRLIGDMVTDQHTSGLLVDDVVVAPAGAAAQAGWQTYVHHPGGGNSFKNIDWTCAGAAWEGSYGVRCEPVCASSLHPSDAPQDFPEMNPFPAQDRGQQGYHYQPKPEQALRSLARVRMTPGQNNRDGHAYLTYNEWHGDGSGSQYQLADFSVPNDGQWHLLSLLSSAHSDAATAMTTVGFSVSGVYDVDGVEVRDQAAFTNLMTGAGMTDAQLLDPQQAGFLRGDKFERYVTAEQLCPAESEAANSFAVYGRQEAVVTNDQIIDWTPDAAAWTASYLSRSAVPLDRPQVTLAHEPQQQPSPGDGRQVRVSGAAADVQDWCAKASYAWANMKLKVSLDLSSERPTWAKLLKNVVSGGSGGAAGSIAAGAAGGGGGTSTAAPAPVTSVNGQTGAVQLAAGDVGAEPALGDPDADGYILSSTAAGMRSWIAPPAGSGTSPLLVLHTAGQTLSGHIVVALRGDGSVYEADSSTALDAVRVLGVTTGAAAAGAQVPVQTGGELTEPTWNWTPGTALFLGLGGVLTQTPPSSGFALSVGVAVSATSMLVRVGQAIVLAH